jgi:hypothetical protein
MRTKRLCEEYRATLPIMISSDEELARLIESGDTRYQHNGPEEKTYLQKCQSKDDDWCAWQHR